MTIRAIKQVTDIRLSHRRSHSETCK